MKVGITCGGIAPHTSGVFLRHSIQAAEAAGFAHYWMPEHVVQFAGYPKSTYPCAAGSLGKAGIRAKFAEFPETLVEPIAEL